MSLTLLLVLIALVCTLASVVTNRFPLWVAVFVLVLVHLLAVLPR